MRHPDAPSSPVRSLRLEGHDYAVHTRPAYPHWDEVSPASHLAGRYVEIAPGQKVLLIGGEQGALALHLARACQPGELWVMEDNTVAMQMIATSLEGQNSTPAHINQRVELPAETDGRFDVVIILHQRGRELSRRRLRIAHEALHPGGALYVAGERRAGIQPVFNDASDLFGEMSVLGYKKGHRIAGGIKAASDSPVPDWLSMSGIRRDSRNTLRVELAGGSHELVSLPGVFSYDHLDEGTALLLEHCGDLDGVRVLDLGCGYGVLGLHAALSGAVQVDLVDISLAALTCARENLEKLGILNGRVLSALAFQSDSPEQYDLVLMNPPFHSGKEVNYNLPISLIQAAHRALRKGGDLVLVANRFIRYERQMSEIFRRAEIIAHTGKFHVITGTK